jgi:8-oxo-dGTP pyrophosphatase MutT (NUDIX family)
MKLKMKNLTEQDINREEIFTLCHSEDKLKKYLIRKLNKHKPRKFVYTQTESRPAAVLIPIFFKQNQAHILFTKRTDKVEHHKGQISFPGGSRDPQDPDLKYTALRETHEEVGIQPEDITVVGQTDVFLTNTHFLVTPFVGFYNYPYAYDINKNEIDQLIEAPLIHFFDREIFKIEPHEKNGYTWQVHYYTFGSEVVWGVTGFLLSNFLSIAFGYNKNLFDALHP